MHKFPAGLLKGKRPDIMKSNVRTMKRGGKSEYDATREAIKVSAQKMPSFGAEKAKHPNRHKNLKTFLHPKKGK